MGRIEAEKMSSTYVRLREDLDSEFREFAEKSGIKFNAAINLAVESFLREERLFERMKRAIEDGKSKGV